MTTLKDRVNRAMRRGRVFAALCSERDYQESRANAAGTPEGEVRPHSVEEFVLYMESYLTEAREILSRTWTPDRSAPPAALHTLRKVTALGVACMEQHGAPMREGFEDSGSEFRR
ncbi:MAG TPA: hypothetical protein VKR31_03960 [Rhizomicrobium sp.]|nr:hypothetical protein [Rhizomicrobium sp.]